MNRLIDLTDYSDSELSNYVYNEESLYLNRFSLSPEYLREFFIFTVAQWEALQADLFEEESEEKGE